jgi:hypothetical protein
MCMHNNKNTVPRHRVIAALVPNMNRQKGPETLACHLTMYIERGRLVGELAQW